MVAVLLVVVVVVVTFVIVGIGGIASPRGAGAATARSPAPLQATATSGGLVVHLSVTRPGPSKTVQVTVSAQDHHAPGALGYLVRFGDGTAARNLVPQYCLAGPGRLIRGRWHFTHRYDLAKTYRISVTVNVNCTRTSATAHVALRVA